MDIMNLAMTDSSVLVQVAIAKNMNQILTDYQRVALTIDPNWLIPEERKVSTAGGDFLKPPNAKQGSKKGGTTPIGANSLASSSSGHNILERKNAESSTTVNTTSNSPLPPK